MPLELSSFHARLKSMKAGKYENRPLSAPEPREPKKLERPPAREPREPKTSREDDELRTRRREPVRSVDETRGQKIDVRG